jgi:hypothetical protein
VPEPITLPVHCAHCGGAVTLQVEDWPVPSSAPADFALAAGYGSEWACLYCQRVNSATMLGRAVCVTKGHAPERSQ